MDDNDELIRRIEEQVHDLIHDNGQHLDAEGWRQLFARVLAGAFNGATGPDE